VVKSDFNPTGTYLRIIYELEEVGIVPRRVRIRERTAQTAATVGQAVARMVRDGLVIDGVERRVEFTEIGYARAVAVVRKQRLAECLLVNVIGLDRERGHVEACLWQHVISDNVERRIIALLDDPTVSPWGLPIPGLTEPRPSSVRAVGAARASRVNEPAVQRLDEFARCGGGTTEVCAIGHPFRSDPTLHLQLASIGIVVGATLTVSAPSRSDQPVSVRTARATVKLPTALAQAVHVRAD
jgi:DtxR family Mn-dependent transcriptional regulator